MRYQEVLLWPHYLGDRPIIWKTGVRLAQQRPLFGYGPETFHLVFDKRHELRDQGVGAWHNFVLQIGVESGIIGVISFFWILASALQILRRARRRREEELAPPVATALLAGLSCMLLAGLFGGVIGDPVIDLLLWSLLGVVAGFFPRGESENSR
jgi:O-antigen ligase